MECNKTQSLLECSIVLLIIVLILNSLLFGFPPLYGCLGLFLGVIEVILAKNVKTELFNGATDLVKVKDSLLGEKIVALIFLVMNIMMVWRCF